MARQAGHIKIEGTIGGLCFYRMDGVYYVRQKSSLTRKRVLKDPKFARSRIAAGRFGVAVKVASSVYRRLPAEAKGHGVIGKLTAVANKLLCDGCNREEALLRMERDYLPAAGAPARKAVAATEMLARQPYRALSRTELRRLIASAYTPDALAYSIQSVSLPQCVPIPPPPG